MQATVTASLTGTFQPVEPSPFRRTLYSKEYTTDKQPRQLSVDFVGMSDSGAKIGLPDQMALYPRDWIKLTNVRQNWLFDCLCLSAYGKAYRDMTNAQKAVAMDNWAKLMAGGVCFNNDNGWERGKRADYIQGLNLGADPMQWEPLVLGGNIVELTGRTENFPTTYLNFGQQAYKHYEIRCIDSENLPLPSDVIKDPCVWHKATTIKPTGETGLFPQFDAHYPIWGKGGRVWVWEMLIAA